MGCLEINVLLYNAAAEKLRAAHDRKDATIRLHLNSCNFIDRVNFAK